MVGREMSSTALGEEFSSAAQWAGHLPGKCAWCDGRGAFVNDRALVPLSDRGAGFGEGSTQSFRRPDDPSYIRYVTKYNAQYLL